MPPKREPCPAYYDPKCEEFARYCLSEAPGHKENEVLDLTGAIQHAVEGWFEKRNRDLQTQTTDWQDRDLPAPANPLKEG